MSTTITIKGQVTIPKNLRDHLGLRAGDQVDFVFAEDGSLRLQPLRKAPVRTPKSRFAALVGVRGKAGRTDRLMEMLRDYASDEDDPGFR